VINKILVSRMKNADFNIGEQAVLWSILKDLSELNSSTVEVLENKTKSLNQKCGRKASHSYLPFSLRTLRSIMKAEVLIWGGGHMLQDQSSAMDIPYHLINVFFAQAMGIPVILYGVEIGPINTKVGRFFSNKALKKINLILVRNQRSKAVLKKIGVNNPNVHVTTDPAFLVSPDKHIAGKILKKHSIRRERPLIGIAPRKAFYKVSGLMPVYLRQKLNLMPRDFYKKFTLFKRKMASVGDYLVNTFDAQILFLPMDVAENQRDDLTCREIRDMMERKKEAHLLEPGLNPSEVTGLIEVMDLIISQRLHALILSCSTNTPMIAISSTGDQDKCKKFMEETGQAENCVDASSMIEEDQNRSFFILVNKVWENRFDIRKELKLIAHDLKTKSSKNIDYVSRWLDNHS